MAHLHLLLSDSRRHPNPYRLLPLLRFSSSNSSSIPPHRRPSSPSPTPRSRSLRPRRPPVADVPSPSPGAQPLPPRRLQRPIPPRQELRFVKDAGPVIAPVPYPASVTPLPDDRPAEEGDGEEAEEGLRGEVERIEMEAARARRSFLGLQVEEQVPYPTLIPVEKRPHKVAVDLVDAIREIKNSANEKKRNFTETVEAHVMLGVDPRRGDPMVHGALTLPHGTGKTVRVAVFAEGPAADEARAAGADVVGGDELIEDIRTGSVANDVSGAVKAAKSGWVDFKIDKTAIVHVGLGKINFSEENLCENIGAFVHALLLAKLMGQKKRTFLQMGPGFPVTIPSLSMVADHCNKVQVSYVDIDYIKRASLFSTSEQ